LSARPGLSCAPLRESRSWGWSEQRKASVGPAASRHGRSDAWVEWEPAKQEPRKPLVEIPNLPVRSLPSLLQPPEQAFANPEDALRHGGLQFHRDDQDVERCLRAHRNDMETIYPFLFLGLVYSFLGPDPFVAQMHFLVFFLGRMVHTVAYLGKLRAPTRSLAYTVAQLPCASMALQIVWEAARHL
uniref:Prostaglandin E synthase n=1 Tax=Equus caballus TaxID=9796 RepID=A0A9L0SI70_HORSE